MLDTTPLHAKHYADGAAFVEAPILENVPLARDTYRLRFEAPTIAGPITPGQFVMVRVAGIDDPLLGRAFALYDLSSDRTAIDIVYLVHGKLTTALSTRQPGDRVEVWGPLGNGFSGAAALLDRLILVAGGIGYTPFLACGREALGKAKYGMAARSRTPLSAKTVSLCYGVRSADLLAGADDFRNAGIDLRVASDDGSIGHHGLVTDLLTQTLDETAGQSRRVACCGPEPMMEAVAEACESAGVRCDVSLETPMACGLGICFSCVAKVRQPTASGTTNAPALRGPSSTQQRSIGRRGQRAAKARDRPAGAAKELTHASSYVFACCSFRLVVSASGLHLLDRLRQTSLRPCSRVGVNQSLRGSLVEALLGDLELGFARCRITGGDRDADFLYLVPHLRAGTAVRSTAGFVLAETLLRAFRIWHSETESLIDLIRLRTRPARPLDRMPRRDGQAPIFGSRPPDIAARSRPSQ